MEEKNNHRIYWCKFFRGRLAFHSQKCIKKSGSKWKKKRKARNLFSYVNFHLPIFSSSKSQNLFGRIWSISKMRAKNDGKEVWINCQLFILLFYIQFNNIINWRPPFYVTGWWWWRWENEREWKKCEAAAMNKESDSETNLLSMWRVRFFLSLLSYHSVIQSVSRVLAEWKANKSAWSVKLWGEMTLLKNWICFLCFLKDNAKQFLSLCIIAFFLVMVVSSIWLHTHEIPH